MFHRETDAAKVARNRDAIFDLQAASLAWLERHGILHLRGYRYCWCPRSSSAAWSTPARSSTTRRASFWINRDQNQKLGRASVIAHETAHMWFGDLVTMRWFDDGG
jgi:aminopeptidase N